MFDASITLAVAALIITVFASVSNTMKKYKEKLVATDRKLQSELLALYNKAVENQKELISLTEEQLTMMPYSYTEDVLLELAERRICLDDLLRQQSKWSSMSSVVVEDISLLNQRLEALKRFRGDMQIIVSQTQESVIGRKKEIINAQHMLDATHEAFVRQLGEIVSKHIGTLYKKYKQTVRIDDYGNKIDKEWGKEIDYFLDNVVLSNSEIQALISYYLGNNLYDSFKINGKKYIIAYIEAYALQAEMQNGHLSADINEMTPLEFERYCADILSAHGWDARITKASGDQGIDVIATYGDTKAVFQCKKYSQPVGNKAVQEVSAGKQFEGASIAAVVSNASYTQSAQQLASTLGIYLLHYSELDSFADRVV